jgi:hypothetical protein
VDKIGNDGTLWNEETDRYQAATYLGHFLSQEPSREVYDVNYQSQRAALNQRLTRGSGTEATGDSEAGSRQRGESRVVAAG